MLSAFAHGDAPFLTGYASHAVWSGPDPVDFIDGATGEVTSIPDGFTNYAVDALIGESIFLRFASNSSSVDKPNLLVCSAEETDVFSLDAQKTGAAGIQNVRDVERTHLDGDVCWQKRRYGCTSARAPSIYGGGEVYRIPDHATPDWTIAKVDSRTFGDDARILTRRPGGHPSLESLNV